MAWYAPQTQPPLPPRPSSTYPSADYDNYASNRLSYSSPPPVQYDAQPMGYGQPSMPPPPVPNQYQQQYNQQYRQPSPRPPQQIWTGAPVNQDRRTSSYTFSEPHQVHQQQSPQAQQYQQSPIPGSYPPLASHTSPRPASIQTNFGLPNSFSAPQLPLPTPRRSLPSPGSLPMPERMPSPGISHPSRPSSTSITSTSSSSTSATAPPSTAAFPTTEGLTLTLPSLDNRSDIEQVLWAQDVLRVLDRHLDPGGTMTGIPAPDIPNPAARIPSKLAALTDRAVPIIISHSSHRNGHISSLASYLRGKLLASGACEDYLPRDPRQAFKDFETAARGGEVKAWYRLGRDYETVGDDGRAKDCFQRGQAKGDCKATYRLGMAHLLGQLGLAPDAYAALSLLRSAYSTASIDCPQPAYVLGMLLAGELEVPTEIPSNLVLPQHTHETSALSAQLTQAREALERAAYLCLPQAQYKCGWMYEHAAYGCAYDPLMSVQWYSLASQGGEIEADMALSKWFLCGAEGHFGKNEKLARTFAEKAARKGHQNGAFAMGYYYELGIGGRKDTEQAIKWYEKASRLGNQEASERMRALSQPEPHFLSAQEHESHLNNTLIRTRTHAAQRSGNRGDRQNRRRDQAERERMMIEADRAARAHRDRAEYGPISPIPEMMMSPSPGGYPQPQPQPQGQGMGIGFQARPPVPYQPFLAPQSTGQPQPPPGPERRRSSIPVPSPTGGVGGQYNQGTDLGRMPSPVKGPQGGLTKGPKTFAEMGFQSKPVEGENCIIM